MGTPFRVVKSAAQSELRWFREGHERAALAYLLNEPRALALLPELLREYFGSPVYQIIFDGIAELHAARREVNVLSVTDTLREKGQLERCGGAAAITSIAIETSSSTIAQYALEQMRDASAKRRAANIGHQLRDGQIELDIAIEELKKLNTESVQGSWLKNIEQAIVTSPELAEMEIPPRKPLLAPWLYEGDYGLLVAERGTGKSWLAHIIAKAISTGGRVGEWQANGQATVVYVDGEMPLDLMRERDQGLGGGELLILNHAVLFDRTEKVLNIAAREVQDAILQFCVARAVKLLVLDNLSVLASGMDENKSFDWERVNNWLLQFRRRRVAVILVLHAGRNGAPRGTSKREDAAFWVLTLDDARKNATDKRGARFISRFVKPSRNTQEEVPAYEWHILTDRVTGRVSVAWKVAQTIDVLRGHIADGISDCSQLAEEMKVSKGTISKWAARGIRDGWLKKDGRDYALVGGNQRNDA